MRWVTIDPDDLAQVLADWRSLNATMVARMRDGDEATDLDKKLYGAIGRLTERLDTARTRVVHVRDNVPGAVYIGRPARRLAGSPFANKYVIGKTCDRHNAVKAYAALFALRLTGPKSLAHQLCDLRGRPLACWCRHDGQPLTAATLCHGDVLRWLLDNYTNEQLLSTPYDDDLVHEIVGRVGALRFERWYEE